MEIKLEGVFHIDEALTILRQAKKSKVKHLTGIINIESVDKSRDSDLMEVIVHWNKHISPSIRKSAKVDTLISACLLKHSKEEIFEAIENFKKVKTHPDTWLYNSRWRAEHFFTIKKYKLPSFVPSEFRLEDFYTYEAKQNIPSVEKMEKLKELFR